MYDTLYAILNNSENATLQYFIFYKKALDEKYLLKTATSFFLPHQNLAKSHHLSSGAKDSIPLKYINTDIREQNIYNYD